CLMLALYCTAMPFFFHATATTEIYTLSLHDALPICMDERFAEFDVLVFGHSHIPWDTTTPSGLRLLNPGSPTDRRRQPVCTFMRSEEHTSELQSRENLVCRLLLEKKKNK